MNIDAIIGRCTDEELIELTKAALENVPNDRLFRDVLDVVLTDDDKQECVARWAE